MNIFIERALISAIVPGGMLAKLVKLIPPVELANLPARNFGTARCATRLIDHISNFYSSQRLIPTP